MAQKVMKVGVKRAKGYLYYLDKKGDVSCAKMARGSKKGGSPKKVAKCGIKRKEGYLYFIDKKGDVSCAKMKRGGKKKKKR
ncbi:MAG: hypothetical protein FJZ08_04030 [Candidatus Omnitrophica bacterium]|nr:hypothetical protein [Candidatus Omnitrophota bacterium]